MKLIIADWIREARQSAGLSQDALGARLAEEFGSERGYTKANISHWETLKHEPSIQQLLAIKRITNKPLPNVLLKEMGFSASHMGTAAANSDALAVEDFVKVVNGYWLATPAERSLILSAAITASENAAARLSQSSASNEN